MDFKKINIIDVNYRKNKYAETFKGMLLKKNPNNVKNKIYGYFKSKGNDDILDMITMALDSSSEMDGETLFLFFGIEDVIGFSDYEDLPSTKYLEKSVFSIISHQLRPIFLNSKRSVALFNKLNPYFHVTNKERDFNWLEAHKSLKVKGLFIGEEIEFTPIEIKWIKEKYKKILIDRNFFKSNILDKAGFSIIEFDSSKIENFYNSMF
jgi:hypothetical protein